MSYRVGQVLYVILKKEASIYPMQVVEEITKKTLEGEITSYMLRAGPDPTKVLAVNDVDGEIFDSAEVAQKTLFDRVSQSIQNRVDQALTKAKEWYPSGFEHASNDPMALIKKTMTVTDQLAASRQAKQVKQQQPRQPGPELAELQAELQAEAEEATMMEVPDGNGGIRMAKVKSVKVPPTMQG
jgi:hypothetical protein